MKPVIIPKIFRSALIWQLLCLGVASLVFSLVLLNRSPNLLRPISMSLRTGFGLIIPVTALLIYATFRIPGRFGELFAVTMTLALFAFPLAGLWASGQTQTTVLSGLIPLYDAQAYYIDSLKLLSGQEFSVFSARRPLFPSLLAVLLSITSRNLTIALSILTAITGIACYFAAREIQRTYGPEAAVFVLMILFLFYRAHTGIAMSENLGVALGALGFGLIWKGTAEHRETILWLGLVLMTLALNARAGTFFMLPLLIIWAGWLFRENGKRYSWRAFTVSFTAVVAGFALNFLLVRILATPEGVPFANFSYTLYGLASGGKSWAYVFDAHPELKLIQEPEQSRKIYQLAFELIREKPWQLVAGTLFNWKMLFSNTWYNVYSYVSGENGWINLIARWGLYILCVLGIVKWIRKPSDPISSLLVIAAFGVFISVPFLPPTDAYRMRPYAASIIVLGTLPALGLVFLLEQSKKRLIINTNIEFPLHNMTVWYGLALTLLIVIGAPIVKSMGRPPQFSQSACASGMDLIMIRYDPGTAINIIRQNSNTLDWLPNYHRSLFIENAHSLADGNLINWTQSIEQSSSLFYTINYLSNQPVLVVADTDLLPNPGNPLQICGHWETSSELASFSIFYATEIQQASQ